VWRSGGKSGSKIRKREKCCIAKVKGEIDKK